MAKHNKRSYKTKTAEKALSTQNEKIKAAKINGKSKETHKEHRAKNKSI